MLIIAPPDDFVGPDEEHPGDEASVIFEARLVGVLLVDLELLLRVLYLHNYKNLLNIINNICTTTHHLTHFGSQTQKKTWEPLISYQNN